MIHRRTLLGWMAAFGVLLAAGGCDSPTKKEPPKSQPTLPGAQEKAPEADTALSEAESAAPATEVPEGLKELSAEDRAAAEKQRICPVTGEALGGMDKPYKIKVKDQVVFLCCQGCEDAIQKNPDKYLDKLNKGAAKQ